MDPKNPKRPSLRLVTAPSTPTSFLVENPAMPNVRTSSSTNLTFTSRGLTVPTVEALVAELAVRREARERANPDSFEWDDRVFVYSRPKVVITAHAAMEDDNGEEYHDELVAKSYPWDHTVWSLLEAAEDARALSGRVYVEQDVTTYVVDKGDEVEDDGTVWLDEGFQVLVADFLPPEARAEIDGDDE